MERISLENDELEGANNVYLFDADDRTVLVDTGERSREDRLREALAAEGVSLAAVDDVLLTHWHPDHSGLAATVEQAGGATVRIHERDAPLATRDEDAWREFLGNQHARLEEWGIPEAKREELFAEQSRGGGPDASLSSVTTFAGGDTFEVGDRELEVIETPGHTAGSVCVAFEGSSDGDREVITGDTILPNYTPNVGGTDTRMEHPLDNYLSSLHALAAGEYERGWPGHREPIADPTGRAHGIVAHHEQRAGQILAILERTGPATVWEVCTELFGELERFHILVGAGEAFAHLDHLERQGDVEYGDGTYRLVDEIEEFGEEVDTWSLSVSDRAGTHTVR
jgi:glyoxylase-like metal-dependent hydrolase (beta-lactamase superfamily II)